VRVAVFVAVRVIVTVGVGVGVAVNVEVALCSADIVAVAAAPQVAVTARIAVVLGVGVGEVVGCTVSEGSGAAARWFTKSFNASALLVTKSSTSARETPDCSTFAPLAEMVSWPRSPTERDCGLP